MLTHDRNKHTDKLKLAENQFILRIQNTLYFPETIVHVNQVTKYPKASLKWECKC